MKSIPFVYKASSPSEARRSLPSTLLSLRFAHERLIRNVEGVARIQCSSELRYRVLRAMANMSQQVYKIEQTQYKR